VAEYLPDITGVLLAGGKSRRMGRDKRWLEVGGRPLLRRALSVLEGLFQEILIVVAEPLPELEGTAHRVVTDLIPDRATLGGLYTGLSYAGGQRIFAAGCDMPFLSREVIAHMVTLDRQADVVMAELATGLQPLHAVYSRACLPHMERMVKAGQLTVQELAHASGLSVRIVLERDLRSIDPEGLSFMNVNTTADVEFVRKLLASRDFHEPNES
jgi:molybdopterin-guanine dinucleotide biosynthesis protein A